MRDVVDEKCKKCAIYQVQSACWNYPGGLTNDSALYCSVVASLHKSQIVCQDRDGGSWRHCEAGHRCLLLTTRDLNEIPREIWTHSVQTPVYHCTALRATRVPGFLVEFYPILNFNVRTISVAWKMKELPNIFWQQIFFLPHILSKGIAANSTLCLIGSQVWRIKNWYRLWVYVGLVLSACTSFQFGTL